MPRSRRVDLPGAVYHVIARGHERKRIFVDRADRLKFLEILSLGLKAARCQCLAWVLMSNHIHLLIRNGEDALSNFMRRILTAYAIYFNRRNRRSGYLFQNRYHSILCQEDAYLLELVRYIHLNPIRAGIVRTVAELDRYPWSGHAALVGTRSNNWQERDAVFSRFSEDRNAARLEYRKFVSEGQGARRLVDLSGGGLRRSAGGWENVRRLRKNGVYWRGDERILGDGDFVQRALNAAEQKLARTEQMKREGWDLNRLITRVCGLFGIPRDKLSKRGRRVAKVKGLKLLS